VLCEGALPFELAAGRPTEFSISSDNLNWGTPVNECLIESHEIELKKRSRVRNAKFNAFNCN